MILISNYSWEYIQNTLIEVGRQTEVGSKCFYYNGSDLGACIHAIQLGFLITTYSFIIASQDIQARIAKYTPRSRNQSILSCIPSKGPTDKMIVSDSPVQAIGMWESRSLDIFLIKVSGQIRNEPGDMAKNTPGDIANQYIYIYIYIYARRYQESTVMDTLGVTNQ